MDPAELEERAADLAGPQGGATVWERARGQAGRPELGPYETEEERAFYWDLPDLLAMVPLGLDADEVLARQAANRERRAALLAQMGYGEAGGAPDPPANGSEAPLHADQPGEVDPSGATPARDGDSPAAGGGPDAEPTGDAAGPAPPLEPLSTAGPADPDPESLGGPFSELMSLLRSELPELRSRDRTDAFAVSFCRHASRGARKRLALELLRAPRSRPELAPQLARLAASLAQCFPDLPALLVDPVRVELLRCLHRDAGAGRRSSSARLAGELVKANVAPPIVALRAIRRCLDDGSAAALEVCAALVESCGRFLTRLLPCQDEADALLERLRAAASATAHAAAAAALENAYYTAKPPPVSAEGAHWLREEDPPGRLERYVRHLVGGGSRRGAEWCARSLRRLDWSDGKLGTARLVADGVLRCALDGPDAALRHACRVLGALRRFRPEPLAILLDAATEELLRGLEAQGAVPLVALRRIQDARVQNPLQSLNQGRPRDPHRNPDLHQNRDQQNQNRDQQNQNRDQNQNHDQNQNQNQNRDQNQNQNRDQNQNQNPDQSQIQDQNQNQNQDQNQRRDPAAAARRRAGAPGAEFSNLKISGSAAAPRAAVGVEAVARAVGLCGLGAEALVRRLSRFDAQRRMALMRLVGCLCAARCVGSESVFSLLYVSLIRGHEAPQDNFSGPPLGESGLPDVRWASVADAPGCFLRVRLVCACAAECVEALCRGAANQQRMRRLAILLQCALFAKADGQSLAAAAARDDCLALLGRAEAAARPGTSPKRRSETSPKRRRRGHRGTPADPPAFPLFEAPAEAFAALRALDLADLEAGRGLPGAVGSALLGFVGAGAMEEENFETEAEAAGEPDAPDQDFEMDGAAGDWPGGRDFEMEREAAGGSGGDAPAAADFETEKGEEGAAGGDFEMEEDGSAVLLRRRRALHRSAEDEAFEKEMRQQVAGYQQARAGPSRSGVVLSADRMVLPPRLPRASNQDLEGAGAPFRLLRRAPGKAKLEARALRIPEALGVAMRRHESRRDEERRVVREKTLQLERQRIREEGGRAEAALPRGVFLEDG